VSSEGKSVAPNPAAAKSVGSLGLRRWDSQLSRAQGVVLPLSASVQPEQAHAGVDRIRSLRAEVRVIFFAEDNASSFENSASRSAD
jgi:hypothetical protein